MKVIGLMPILNEGDLLPEVLPHVKGLVDDLLVYEGGSVDNSYDVITQYTPTYLMTKKKDTTFNSSMPRYPYHHLLEEAKKNYDFKRDDVWAMITMGDRFFLNKPPRKIVEDAEAEGFVSVEGMKTEFLRCRADPWTEENDTFPDYSDSLRKLCRWTSHYERQIFAFKITDSVSYIGARYPWPTGIGRSPQYSKDFGRNMNINMPFHEHHGRRSPRALKWRYDNGCIGKSRKHGHSYDSVDSIVRTFKGFYNSNMCIPWIGMRSLEQIVRFYNGEEYKTKSERRSYYKGIEHTFIHTMGRQLLPRRDI